MGAMLSTLLQKLRHQTRPTGLMARTDPRAIVPMEIFVEQGVVFPMRVILECFIATKDGTPVVGIEKKGGIQTMGDFHGGLPERYKVSGAGWAFHFKVIPKIVIKLLQGFDH